jgi:hypothetical protein
LNAAVLPAFLDRTLIGAFNEFRNPELLATISMAPIPWREIGIFQGSRVPVTKF